MPSLIDKPAVVVTGANGFVGSHVCTALLDAGATVRAIVRRPGTVSAQAGLTEHVGSFADAEFSAPLVAGAHAVVTTAHPMWSDLAAQRRVAIEGTPGLARMAAAAGVERVIHISTAGVYRRTPGSDDLDESASLIDDNGGDYAVTKRDAETALATIQGVTGVFLRPPVIFGPGESSEFNTIRPAAMRSDPAHRRVNPDMAVSWVHVTDLARFAADLAVGNVAASSDPSDGPVEGGWTPVNVASGTAAAREYVSAIIVPFGVEPNWSDEPTWTGGILAERAHGWGWRPTVALPQALKEISKGLVTGG